MFRFTCPYKGYPPLSNKDYTLTTHYHNTMLARTIRQPTPHKFCLNLELRDQDQLPNNSTLSTPTPTPTTTTLPTTMSSLGPPPPLDAGAMADTIHWESYDWNEETCESGGPIFPLEQARADCISVRCSY